MDEFCPHEALESMNLNGQSQPSLPPSSPDCSLNDQILNDVFLVSYSPSSICEDDVLSSALIDERPTSLDNSTFESNGTMPDFTLENLESPTSCSFTRQSTIEESLDSISLSQSQTDYSLHLPSITTGRSPVEHSVIDNRILADRCVRRQGKLYRNASKSHRQADYHRASATVAPFNGSSNQQTSPNVQMQSDSSWNWPSIESKKIQIIGQPRERFRPRTQNESQIASHYLRCAPNSPYEYPTISIPSVWAHLSSETFIEVTLVKANHQPHRYTIGNKTAKNDFQNDALIFRQNDLHTLYYRVTENEFSQGYKNFHIEFIKGKQDGVITKKIIQEEQLDKSKLRFTRLYFDKQQNAYQRDESSTEYSCLMVEAYADVSVEHFGPRYGSKLGENVYMLMKGQVQRDDLIVEISESTSGLYDRPTLTKNGNLVLLKMPDAQHILGNEVTADVKVFYKGEQLFQTSYVFTSAVDDLLSRLRISETSSTSTSNDNRLSMNAFDFFAATGAHPTSRANSNGKKSTKRLEKKK